MPRDQHDGARRRRARQPAPRRAGRHRGRRDGARRIGAATTLAAARRRRAARVPAPVVESIASPTIRNLATVGGNLFVAQPYGDLAVALLALDAEVEVAGPGGAATPASATCSTTAVRPRESRDRGRASPCPPTAVLLHQGDAPPAELGVDRHGRRRRSVDGGTVAPRASRSAAPGAGPVRARAGRGRAGGPAARPRARRGRRRAPRSSDAEPFSDAYASAWYRARVLPVHVRRALIGE